MIDRAYAAWDRGVAWARKRSSVFDHIWRAQERYGEVLGARLAAAIAYYGFFAALALSLLAFSVLGYLLAGDHRLYNAVDEYLAQNLPFLNTDDIQNSRQTIAIVSVVGLLFTGTSWIDGMRSSQRAVWRLDQQPGNVLLRRVIDLGMLVGLGLLLALSLGVASVLEWVVRHLLAFAEPERTDSTLHDVIESVLSGLGPALSFLVNMAVAAGLLAGVPRLHVPLRRLLPSVILVAGGLTLLSTVGRVLISHAQYNPAYQVAGWAVGLLIFINLFSQLVLFGAALAATGQRGRVVDLAIRSPADPESDGDRG